MKEKTTTSTSNGQFTQEALTYMRENKRKFIKQAKETIKAGNYITMA